MASTFLFEMFRGDDYALRLEITASNGTPIDITGWTFRSSMKLSTEEPDENAPVFVEIPAQSGSDAEAGVVYVNLPSSQTKDLLPAPYFFDLQREFNGKVSTVFAGKVKVKADVTRRTG